MSSDWNAVADKLGYQAARNKTGKSGLLHGAIKGKIIKDPRKPA